MNRCLTPCAVVLFVFLWAVPVQAGEAFNCNTGSEAEFSECLDRTFAAEQALLDKLAREILAALDKPAAQQRFKDAQAAWETYRDAQCQASIPRYDSDVPVAGTYTLCLSGMTRARIAELTGGTDGPIAIARLLQTDTRADTVFWHTDTHGIDYDMDGIFDVAYFGLLPGNSRQPAATYVLAVLFGGTDQTIATTIPVARGQGGLCEPEAILRFEHPENELPYLVVDDNACDAFRFRVKQDRSGFEVFRH